MASGDRCRYYAQIFFENIVLNRTAQLLLGDSCFLRQRYRRPRPAKPHRSSSWKQTFDQEESGQIGLLYLQQNRLPRQPYQHLPILEDCRNRSRDGLPSRTLQKGLFGQLPDSYDKTHWILFAVEKPAYCLIVQRSGGIHSGFRATDKWRNTRQ